MKARKISLKDGMRGMLAVEFLAWPADRKRQRHHVEIPTWDLPKR